MRATRRDRPRVRVGMHTSSWRDPTRSHLRDAARGAGFPRRLGSEPDGCSDQRRRDQIFMVALSGWRAPVDRASRRIAVPNYLSGRARTGGNVFELSLTTRKLLLRFGGSA